MTKGIRTAGVGLLLILLAGLVPGSAHLSPPTVADLPAPVPVPPAVNALAAQAQEENQGFIDMDFSVQSQTDERRLTEAITAVGGEVTVQERNYVRARVPAAVAASLPEVVPVTAVGVNQELSLDPAQVPPPATSLTGSGASDLTAANFDAIGVGEFRRQTGSTGRGVLVAVIDSGADPGHPALAETPAGAPKIVEWKDFTREGYVTTNQVVQWAGSFTAADGRMYWLPQRPSSSRAARFGYWDENYVFGYINQDLDRNGEKTDRFGVLVVDSKQTGVYDTVYVDTNNDGDFSDEAPLVLYGQGGPYASLGQNRSGPYASRRLNFVVAELAADGRSVRLGFDGQGHGTQVAGVLGAFWPDGYSGLAPGAQLMVLKAIKSNGNGEWFQIKDAILYAATHGAQVINISLGGLSAGAAKEFDTGASEWLNKVATDYHVLIVLSADNSGPGLSSGATLGNPSVVLAVGSYYSPEMWKRDYNWVVPHESIWFFSGMGPRSDGSYLPSVVAPGGSPTTSPQWRDPSGFASVVGTSVATPHVAGAAALLIEAARQEGVQSDWLSVKRALEMGTRKIPGFEAYEQGNGLIQLRAAYSHLQRINSVPTVRGQGYNGGGGLLARSYTPGSSAFWLSNLGKELSRVTVFSSEPWVIPAYRSMTLPPDVPRLLPLSLKPPQDQGAHSAFLLITNQDQYGPSLSLPVTYVRPIEFSPALDYTYNSVLNLEAGRYRRYFFQVKPGVSSLSVTARVPLNQPELGKGTVQVHVFRPDGQPAHSARIGIEGDGLTTLFQTADPVEGVWEVVVVALPDSRVENISPGYTLEVKTRPGALPNPLHLNVQAGSEIVQQVTLSNVFGAFTGYLDTMGLVPVDSRNPWQLSVPWHVERKGSSSIIDSFTLEDYADELQIDIDNPVPADADLSLALYRLDAAGVSELIGQSNKVGTSRETVRQSSLSPGTYKVLVTGSTDPNLTFQYRRLVGIDAFNLSVDDASRRHQPYEVWSAPLAVRAPDTPGRYIGQVLVRETDRRIILGWYPITVSVGQPALKIESKVAQLTRNQASKVVLEVRNAESGALVPNPVLTVNGQRYLGRDGQVTVTVVPTGSTQVLEVEGDMAAYQFVQERFTLPVKESWGAYPLGADSGEDYPAWRRKLTNQLP